MKTYFFFILFIFGFFCGSFTQTFAAHDDTFAQMNSSHTALYSMTLEQQESAIEKAQTPHLSWKNKIALKIVQQKIAKAERKIKQGKKANAFGGLVALIVIGALLIPFGILVLLPLLIVGVVLLALGIVGSVFRGVGRAVWW